MSYLIHQTQDPEHLSLEFSGAFWAKAPCVTLDQFRVESSSHRPVTQAKLLYSAQGIYGIFEVQDQYVRCVNTEFQSLVCQDSCVEVYFKPFKDKGYLNLEISGNGTLLSYYITDSTRAPGGFKAFVPLTVEQGRAISIKTTLAPIIEPEITEPLRWSLAFFLPFSVLEAYVGSLGTLEGQVWTGNFFKCADQTSHPHWASWQVVPELNFHMPETFGELRFA